MIINDIKLITHVSNKRIWLFDGQFKWSIKYE